MKSRLHLVGDAAADQLLADDPLALLVGMLLDQQVTIETAFAGPKKIADRMDGLSVERIATADPDEFAKLCATPPAIHRFPGSMAKRIQALCAFLLEHYDGEADGVWRQGGPTGAELLKRLKALPGFGEQKARIFLALLGKQLDVRPRGWREAAGDFGVAGSYCSVADIVDKPSLDTVRAHKKAAKAAAKGGPTKAGPTA
ncbi:MAG TPA: HhH-GPD-type base excision DNA repair protein [Pseudonocardiaceae bacterium]|jgi:uncharacterized HhH-GPD family protein|nr:HhH-GPD-type base excision DNA repair protein [Pseudonocardiaceae bacterium]